MAADFSMHAGDTKVLAVLVKTAAGQPVDVSAVELRFQIGRGPEYRPPLISKSVGNGIVVVDGPAGAFDVTIDPEDTSSLKGLFYYEGEMVDGEIVSTVVWGYVQIQPALIDSVGLR